MNLLSSLIQGQQFADSATATPATIATESLRDLSKVAKVATVAVAEPPEPLPLWCSKSCSHLEEVRLPDGMIMGCIHDRPGWRMVWTRLDVMGGCPLRDR